MIIAEAVTFGGSGLDRAAQLRGQVTLDATPDARAILLWRGKPMIACDRLVRVLAGHRVLEAGDTPVFLGVDEGIPTFAVDLSRWAPDDLDTSTLDTFLDPSEQRHPDLPEDHVFTELRAILTLLSPRDAELAATARAIQNWHASHGFCAKCGAKSDMVMSGWQRNCPACDTQHFPRTDPVVIMLITHNNNVLMGRSPNWPEGMYSLLAGFVEPGETLEAAVRREVFEEAGIRVGAVSYLSSQPWPFPASLMFGCQGAATSTDITIDPIEIEDAVWVSREEMADIFAGQHATILPARRGAIAHFLLENWLADRLD